MKNMKKLGLVLLGFLTLLFVLPFLIPMSTYLEQAEKEVSDVLGAPVGLKKARLSFLPTPHVSVSDVVIGKGPAATAAELIITPTLGTLFSDQRIIDVQLKNVVLKKSALAVYDKLTHQNKKDKAPSPVALRNLSVKHLRLNFSDTKLPVSDVYITLKNNNLDSAKVNTVDGKIKATLIPDGAEHHILLKINRWEMPTETKLMINAGEFDMRLKGSQLDITHYTMSLYDGEATGKATLSWSKAWQVNGDLTVKHLSLNKPSRLISPSTYMSGHLDGDGRFSSSAADAGQLADHLRADFKFTVNNGVLHGLDLIKAASLLVKQDAGGGETQFDQFSGKLRLAGRQYKLSNLDIRSGLLAANGHVKVTSGKKLDGLVEVELKKSVGLVAVPLSISGSVESPMVLPSKAAMAGAAVGTAVLGPGVGTSLGIKASKGLDKLKKGLFGDDDD